MKVFRKLYQTKATSIDDDAHSVSFIISTDEVDRYGDVVDQKSWDFKSYLKNPIVLWGHDPSEPENVLGTASSLDIAKDGSQTTATLTFDTDINPNAGLIFNQIKRGTLRTVSVGFRNHTMEWQEDTPVLKDNELLEISVVPIPANAGAIALSYKAGEINRKDAEFLLDSMRKEADLLAEELKATRRTNKEKTMTDEQAQSLISGIAKLTEDVEKLTADNQSLRDEVAELKPVQETDEEKAAREEQGAKDAKDAEDKAAAEKAEADKKAADEEAASKAEEDAKTNDGKTEPEPGTDDDPAKGGSNDQPGAGDESDDLDEDAELTDELREQIDAELETANAN